MSTMFSWREVNPAPGEPVAPDERLPWGRTDRARRPARGGDVRRHVRVPAGDGARPQPGHHVLRDLHDPVPADHLEPGAQLPRHQRVVRGQRARDPRPGRRLGRRHRRRSWSPASCSPLVGVLVHFAGSRRDPQGPAAGGHRRRRDADRLQPGARGGRHLLAAGPVDRPPRARSWSARPCCCPASGRGSRCSSRWSSATCSPGWPTCSSAPINSVTGGSNGETDRPRPGRPGRG